MAPQVRQSRRFQRQCAKLPPDAQNAVWRAVRYFHQPRRTQPLSGFPGLYELRAGPWRIIWHYDEHGLIVLQSVDAHDRALARP